jgi:hypothetical protein
MKEQNLKAFQEVAHKRISKNCCHDKEGKSIDYVGNKTGEQNKA